MKRRNQSSASKSSTPQDPKTSTVKITVNQLNNIINALSDVMSDKQMLLSFSNSLKLSQLVKQIDAIWQDCKEELQKITSTFQEQVKLIDENTELSDEDKKAQKAELEKGVNEKLNEAVSTEIEVPVIPASLFKTTSGAEVNLAAGNTYTLQVLIKE